MSVELVYAVDAVSAFKSIHRVVLAYASVHPFHVHAYLSAAHLYTSHVLKDMLFLLMMPRWRCMKFNKLWMLLRQCMQQIVIQNFFETLETEALVYPHKTLLAYPHKILLVILQEIHRQLLVVSKLCMVKIVMFQVERKSHDDAIIIIVSIC